MESCRTLLLLQLGDGLEHRVDANELALLFQGPRLHSIITCHRYTESHLKSQSLPLMSLFHR